MVQDPYVYTGHGIRDWARSNPAPRDLAAVKSARVNGEANFL